MSKNLRIDQILSRPYIGLISKNDRTPQGVMEIDPESPEMAKEFFVVDPPFPPSVITQFAEFCRHGQLPTGQLTELQCLSADHADLLHRPYADWASLSPFPRVRKSPMQLILARCGSTGVKYKRNGADTRKTIVEKSLAAMKARIWEGIAPFTEEEWRSKKLDEKANFQNACQSLGLVINTFHYMNEPVNDFKRLTTFLLIYEFLEDFDKNRRALADEANDALPSTTELWAAYIQDLYHYIASRAHSWVHGHVMTWYQEIRKRITEHEPVIEANVTDELRINAVLQADMMDILTQADYSIFLNTFLYKGIDGINPPSLPSPDISVTEPVQYHPRSEFRERLFTNRLAHLNGIARGTPEERAAEFERTPIVNERLLKIQNSINEIQDQVRLELRGPSQDYKAKWVADVKRSGSSRRMGFVAYRVDSSNTETNEQWEEFLTSFYANMMAWYAEDSHELQDVREACTIQWEDGRHLQPAERSLETIHDYSLLKEHFQSLTASESFSSGIRTDVFLVADFYAVASFIKSRPTRGQLGPHILAIDTRFTPALDSDPIALYTQQGYPGRMRILSSVFWDDFAALLSSSSQTMLDLWPLAMLHWRKVYSGPVVPVQRDLWLEQRQLKDAMLHGFERYVRERGGVPEGFDMLGFLRRAEP